MTASFYFKATRWSSAIRERLASALSPESLRRRAGFQDSPVQVESSAEETPPLKISEPNPSPKPNVMGKNDCDEDGVSHGIVEKTNHSSTTATSKFYDVPFEGSKTPEFFSLGKLFFCPNNHKMKNFLLIKMTQIPC